MAAAMAEHLVGRARELAQVEAALDDARAGTGGALIIEGAAGMGKTSLLEAAKRRAVMAGMHMLAGRGSPLEHEFAMGVVRQCFDPVVRDGGDLFEGAAARARSVVAGVPESVPGAPEEVLHAFFWLTANLAARAPVALVIDDAQWADEASLRFAAYLALRMDSLPVAMLVAMRSGEADSAVLRAIRDTPAARVFELRGLTEGEVEEVLRTRRREPVDAAFARACAEATGGNPFLLNELISALAADGVPFTAAGAPRVPETTTPSVTRRVEAALDGLDPAARALARAAAVLGDDVALELAGELAGVEVEAAASATAALTRAGLFADAMPLRFRHPLLATAVRATLSTADRAAGHLRAAELMRARAAGSERVALHLLHTTPAGDPAAVAELRAAAALAVRRGAPTAAVALLRRALAEPPPQADLAEVLLELGSVEYAVGSGHGAAEHLEAAHGASEDPRVRARALLALMHSHEWGGVEGMRRLGPRVAEATRQVEPVDRELALRLRTTLLAFPGVADDALTEARELAGRLAGATPGEAILLSGLAFVLTWTDASAAEVAELATRAIVQTEAVIADGAMTELVAGTLLVLRWTDRLDAARRLLDGAVASAQRRGSTTDFVIALSQRAAVHRRAGRLTDSEADARAAVATDPDPRWWYLGHTYAALVGTLIDQGRLDDAAQELAHLPSDETSDSPAQISLILERMRLEGARGEHGAALSHWSEAFRRASALRGISPAWIDDLAVAAEAHSAVGDHASAQALRDEALALAQRWDTPGALAVALRARGDHVGAIEHARRSPAKLELARALVAHGAQLRRAGERVAARDPLREGFELSHECGAAALAGFARAELRVSGVRVQREALSGADALTASERRIAELAATGMSNAEIAQSQFLTVKTVEMHLTRAYRKLGVSGRRELLDALS